MGFAVALLVIIVMINIYNYLVFLLYKHVRVPQEALMIALNLNHWFIRKKDIDDIIRRGADPNYKNGLPLGMQIIGRAFDEETVFKAAEVLEKQAGFKGAK